MNTEMQLRHQREYRIRTENVCTKRYEKTINGFLMRTYRNMKSRVCGIQWRKRHLYQGKELLPKEVFYTWSKMNKDFLELYKHWKLKNYKRRICPSIDRVDSSKGYVLKNMRWITFSENCRQGALSKYSKIANLKLVQIPRS